MLHSIRQVRRKFRKQKYHQDFCQTELNDLYAYLNAGQPSKKSLIRDCQLVAVDFETTGLDPRKSEIISMGFCPIHDNVIRLSDCLHITIKTEQDLTSENVAIHGLTHDVLSQGMTQKQALLKFIELTKDKIIVAHYHSIERNFIQRLAKKLLGQNIPLSFLDTYLFAKKRMHRRQQVIVSDSLRLFSLRKQQGLPYYKAHNALEDAISTAELYLAQKQTLDAPEEKRSLKDMGLYNYKP